MSSYARLKVAYFTDKLVLVELVSYAVAAMVVDAKIVTSSTILAVISTVVVAQCTMCILGTMFTFQPNKLRHILKDAS